MAALSPGLADSSFRFPLGFRATCYYYRKAYYRAFFLDPPACAVSESSKRNYCGETVFPFILQNLHRYFLYARARIFHGHSSAVRRVSRAFNFNGKFGIGVGTRWCCCSTSFAPYPMSHPLVPLGAAT